MKVGDLVTWKNSSGVSEMGVVIEDGFFYTSQKALVWFFLDHASSWMSASSLELV